LQGRNLGRTLFCIIVAGAVLEAIKVGSTFAAKLAQIQYFLLKRISFAFEAKNIWL
jgi:hypothetical protein